MIGAIGCDRRIVELDGEAGLPARRDTRRSDRARGALAGCARWPEVRLHRSRSECGEVEAVGVEGDDRELARWTFQALQRAVRHDEQGVAVELDDARGLGEIGERSLDLPAIVEEETLQLAISRPVANVDRQPVLDLDEPTRLDDGGHDVGAHLGDHDARLGQPGRAEVDDPREHDQRTNEGGREGRPPGAAPGRHRQPRSPPARCPC